MGLILDSSVAIFAESRKAPVEDLLAEIRAVTGPTEIGLSVVSVMELEHGIWRARDASRAKRRREFLEDLIETVPIYPLTVELARKAGRIDAELQEKGIRVAFPDLLIGVLALDLGYGIVTENLRHFERIPGLTVTRLLSFDAPSRR
jgi:tRNA(fMet)-specific endonuclease VapC